jgi:hypothetical protein
VVKMEIRSRPTTKEYRNNYDQIVWPKKLAIAQANCSHPKRNRIYSPDTASTSCTLCGKGWDDGNQG